jgi:hypothetical protein
MTTTTKDKPLVEQVLDKVAELTAQASDADRALVEKLRQPDYGCSNLNITPVQAALILEHNGHNRNLNNPRLNSLMGVLVRGEWRPTHQGIAFYNDGVLMDGQHRLGACVLTDIPLAPIMVSGGFDKKDNVAIDAGGPRKAKDAAKLAGQIDADLKCAVVEQWMKYDHYLHYGSGISFTNTQITVKSLEHDAALVSAIAMADQVIKTCTLGPMTRKEIAARAFEMNQGGWSPVYTMTLLTLVNQGTADYDGAPTVFLSEAYSKDRDDKFKNKLSTLQRQAMWHKVAALYSHKSRVAKGTVMWKVGQPVPKMSPPADTGFTTVAAE